MKGARAVNKYVRDDIDPRVLPTLKNKATALEQYAESQGIVFGYPDYSGWRSKADTTQLIAWRDEAVKLHGPDAYYPVAPYGQGYHGKGSAFDIKIVLYPKGKTLDWAYATLGAYAPRIGLRWGGTFSGRNKDIFHFELAITLDAAQRLFDAFQSAQHAVSIPVLASSPSQLPKVSSQPLTVAVMNAKPTTIGAAALAAVAALAIVGGFFLALVGVVNRAN